ncbi:Hypothetical protein PHPALM_12598 [Phytophthora palmivora]|uniref:Uncharacterized protein n=1 Tax=Phytophthora palmivora TaxID=4796 RepID=A0A2P4XZD3_9STRA|nr:Hypothetical protein PHPALM_12598 [Phytophthora palmivora]
MCDPRKEKTLCTNCSMLWHSRGFARTHQLTNNNGETRSFSTWELQRVSNGNGSTVKPVASETESSAAAVSVQAQEVAVNGTEDTKSATTDEEMAQEDKGEETKQDGDESMDDLDVVGESVDSGEDAVSVEQTDELEEKGWRM